MDLLHLVDRLEELVAAAQKMPIGNRAIVDRRRLLDIVDQMRIAIPQEVRDAQDMVNRRDAFAREAEEEARMIVARAEQRAGRLVEEHEITQAARQRAEEIGVQAEHRLQERIAEANREIAERVGDSRSIAEQQMTAADAYAKELLERLHGQLRTFVRSVESGIEQLEPERQRNTPLTARQPQPRPRDDGLDLEGDELDDGEAAPMRLRRPSTDPEQLLRRAQERDGSPRDARGRPEDDDNVIDDLDMPTLDDDPTQPRPRERARED